MSEHYWSLKARGSHAEILIYEEIGEGPFSEVNAKGFIAQLDALKTTKTIDLRINSPGGSVFEGLAIYNALRRHPAEITAHIDGLAASMASVIPMAAARVLIAENALLMIHSPWMVAGGNADELRRQAELLDRAKASLLMAYREKTAQPDEVINAWMSGETWFDAAEALVAGLVDEISTPVKAVAQFDLARFRHPPAPRAPLKTGADTAMAAQSTPQAGQSLASFLNRRIDERITDERTRADIIQAMADAAGIEPGTVSQILDASINCPPRERLDGFAAALETALGPMIEAAERDGCRYNSQDATSKGPMMANDQPNTPAATNPAAQPQTPVGATGRSPESGPKPWTEPDQTAIRAQVLQEEANRRAQIRAVFSPFGETHRAELDACLDDAACTVDQARARLLAKMGQGAQPLAGQFTRVDVGETDNEKFRKGVSAALLVRSNLGPRDDAANEFRGYTLLEIARRALALAGIQTGRMDKMQVVAAAFTHTTSDFTNLLANTANKALLKGWDEAEETFQRWTSVGNLPDFKATSRVDLNLFPSLSVVPDGGEYSYATVGDRGETIQLATYGKLFSINRQAIINDDLDAFTRIPRRMGRAAIRTVGNLAYAVLTDNGAMADGVALFHANHNNLAASGAAPSVATFDAARAAMAKQTDPGGETLNIRPAYWLGPVGLQSTAQSLVASEADPSQANSRKSNPVRGMVEVVADARLDANSATAWYLASNPMSHDVVEVAYLDGNSQPVLEQQMGWSVDGTEFKVRIDAGVKALDHRTLYKNPGV